MVVRFVPLIATALLWAGASTAQQSPLPVATAEEVGINPIYLDRASLLLNRFVAEQKIAGAVAAVARRGQLVYLETVGFADFAETRPMTPNAVFRIYSMTKPVTAVAAMILHEEGRFELDDAVSRFIPEFDGVVVMREAGAPRAPTRAVTVRDLMLHTSGLNHRTSQIYRDEQVRSRALPLTTFITNIVEVPLMEDPGTRYRYSEGTTVLGRLVEIWSGQTLDSFLQERIFAPLGMVDTGFQVRPDQLDRLTTVYAPAETGGLTPTELEEVPFTERPALLEGAVGLVSTVPDYLRFSQMLLNGGQLEGARILREETVQQITRNGLSDEIVEIRGSAFGWGLGNVNVLLDASRAGYPANAGEYGWDGSAGTIFWVDPATEIVTILMTQSSPANPDRLRQQFKTIIAESRLN